MQNYSSVIVDTEERTHHELKILWSILVQEDVGSTGTSEEVRSLAGKRGIIYRLTFSFNANSIFLIYS